jgi:hypothetical protein
MRLTTEGSQLGTDIVESRFCQVIKFFKIYDGHPFLEVSER